MTITPTVRLRLTAALALWLPLAVAPASAAVAAGGEQIYRERCASCHGAKGEGTLEEYPHPLVGEKSVGQLTRLIAKTMPADDPGTITGPEAEKVAAFIHETFYSKAAQVRNKPARVELARLTVRQYRNAVADLIGTFRTPGKWEGEGGLKAEYYKSRRFRTSDSVLSRVDPEVNFDFGTAAPVPEKIEPHEFSMRWEGSVRAPESGEYEFIVRTEHAARLWVNDTTRPLIDAWVKSGNDTEYRGTITLLGGRAYPIRLEYSKAKQGVDDSKKTKKPPPEVKSSIRLEWKPPQKVAEVVPRFYLATSRIPETFVATTPFPPDDRSTGYERGTTVSKAWDQATTDAAVEVAGYVSGHLRELSGVFDAAKKPEQVRDEFCRKFVERAFRRPLSDEERKLYVDRQFERTRDTLTAVKRVVLLALKSPRFLYREVGGGRDPYDVASRLSFGLWDSIPDQGLLDAAAGGKLGTRDEVAQQAGRMLDDLRTRAKVREFLLQWLRVDQAPDLSKDPGKYPDFTPAVAADLRTSLDLFLDEVVWGDPSDFRQVLLADFTFLNGRLAKVYGADLPEDAPFTKYWLDPTERAGVLSHPYLLAAFAYTATSSPIHRGVFLARNVLGRALRPPPVAVAPLAPDLHAGLTTRERTTLQTRPEACQSCHTLINPLGYTLEHFDAIGRYRKDENGKPINDAGAYQTRDGGTVSFDGTRDLAAFLAGSDETHGAFVQQFFHYLVKQPVRAFGPDALADLRKGFAAHGYSVRALTADAVAASALTPGGVNP
jgi:hypothetical protein